VIRCPMEEGGSSSAYAAMGVLAITQGLWGERIADNILAHAPAEWRVERWAAPARLPQVIDDPEDFLPAEWPATDLVLALGDTPGVAQLIPEIARLSGARAVLAPIDREESLPPGLAHQLAEWLAQQGIDSVFPKPFCSLTENTVHWPPLQQPYEQPLVSAFAAHFGAPRFEPVVEDGRIARLKLLRDSACGCGRAVAEGLIGRRVEQAEEEAGMLHHHFPCLASMNQDPGYHDTLMHVSGRVLKDSIKDVLRPFMPVHYLQPVGLVEDD
jgi:hypothetical protein